MRNAFFIQPDGRTVAVNPVNVTYFESDNDHTNIYFTSSDYITVKDTVLVTKKKLDEALVG